MLGANLPNVGQNSINVIIYMHLLEHLGRGTKGPFN
jgi:hypothetical protein